MTSLPAASGANDLRSAPVGRRALPVVPDLHAREPNAPRLIDLMRMSYEAWDAWSRGRAVRRAGRAGFFRNVAVALGNWGSAAAVPVLTAALSDPEPLVRGHAVWALAEIASDDSWEALEALRSTESDPFVLEELDEALAHSDRQGRTVRPTITAPCTPRRSVSRAP